MTDELETGFGGFSLDPEDAVSNPFMEGWKQEIKEACYVKTDLDGHAQEEFVALRVSFEAETSQGRKVFVQTYPLGATNEFTPVDDGKRIKSLNPSVKGIRTSKGAYIFFQSLVNAGFDPKKLRGNPDVNALLSGLKVETYNIPQGKSKTTGKQYMVVGIKRILSNEEFAAETAAELPSKARESAKADAPKPADEGSAPDWKSAVVEVLIEAGKPIELSKLPGLCMKKFKGQQSLLNAIIQNVSGNGGKKVREGDNPWTVDGNTISIGEV